MDLFGQNALDECLAECCDKLDFTGVCKAIENGANANCTCTNEAWWYYCCITRILDAAYHGDDVKGMWIALAAQRQPSK